MFTRLIFLLVAILGSVMTYGQVDPSQDIEKLKQQVLELRVEVDQINLNLQTSQNKFKRGIAVATVGYSLTIAGGLMLGRKNDDLGKGLLVVGGGTGITGTILMVDAFKHLTRQKK